MAYKPKVQIRTFVGGDGKYPREAISTFWRVIKKLVFDVEHQQFVRRMHSQIIPQSVFVQLVVLVLAIDERKQQMLGNQLSSA